MTKELWSDYTLDQLEALVSSAQIGSLERTDFKHIIEELIERCSIMERSLGRF